MNKINIYKVFIYLMLINVFFSLTYQLYPPILPMGRIVGFLQIIVIIWIYLKTLKKMDIWIIFFLIVFDLIAIFRISEPSIDLENLIYFTSTCLIIWKFCEKEIREKFIETFKKDEKKIFFITIILLSIPVLGLFYKKAWVNVNGINTYMGLCDSGHKLSGNMCFCASVFLIYFMDKRMKMSNLVYFLVPFMIVLVTGSRTYCISYICILLILYITKLREYKLKIILIPVAFVVIFYMLINSSIFERFFAMGNNQYVSDNFLEATSSGRLIWWKIDIDAFLKFDFVHKIIGRGFTYLYNLNLMEYGLSISAHNDFLTLLIGGGIFGIFGYVIILLKWFFKDKGKNRKLLNFLAFAMIMINACISGFYGAQQYLFANIVVSLAIYVFYRDREKKDGVQY